ncbi:MAG: HD domain-containing protein [Bdellovibrionales bacterium]|nr:HD domain-containing protein [Bdellovibrionales bacterium]
MNTSGSWIPAGASLAEGEKQLIANLKDKDAVKTKFLVNNCQTLVDKNGKPYMSFELSDASGTLNGRLWERAEEVTKEVRAGDFVEVKGHVQLFQNRLQIVLHEVKKTQITETEIKGFVSPQRLDPEKVFTAILKFVDKVGNPYIKNLLLNTLQDKDLKPIFMSAPAAKSIHHAYIGGLSEHILSILQVMESLGKNYPLLDADYLIFGAIYHDIGKVYELGLERGIQYTDVGRLVGHMGIACEFIDTKAREIENFPEELKNNLKHIVYSHHGRLEYGSPKEPMFPEAFVVALIDDLDSKLNTMMEFMQSEISTGEKWTRYHQGFDRYFFLEILRARLEKDASSHS